MQNKKSLNHLAIIMDGNGRWAIDQDLPRTAGHAAGEHSLSRTIDWAIDNRLEWLTVYAFSTENWLRSEEEVDFLMFFNRDILIRRRDEFNQKGVRFRFLGDLTDEKIPDENKELMGETENLTQNNNKLNLNFAAASIRELDILLFPSPSHETVFPSIVPLLSSYVRMSEMI